MVDMLLPAMDMGMPLLGPLMVDMLLPAMDMEISLLGPLMVDMLLPAMGMPLPEPLIFFNMLSDFCKCIHIISSILNKLYF